MLTVLTDKCKEDFKKWYHNQDYNNLGQYWYWFYEYPISMQYGVYVDFFDSVGIYINDFADNTMSVNDEPRFQHWGFGTEIELDCEHIESPEYKDRIDSRKFAIIKANEIYNSIKN